MRIVGGATGEEALQALAAEMLCLEAGRRGWGADGAPLPPPHAPWPLVAVPPRTAGAPAAEAHYRAAVGVVFSSAPAAGLARALAALLRAAGDAHLAEAPRACLGTSAGVVRASGRVRAGGALVLAKLPPLPEATQRAPAQVPAQVPARLFVTGAGTIWTAPGARAFPSHIGWHAAFTWHFLPLGAAAALGGELPWGEEALPAANASIAGLVFDPAGRFGALPPGAAGLPRGALEPAPPAGLDLEGLARAFASRASAWGRRPALVLWPDGSLAIVGQARRAAPPPRLRPPPLEDLPPLPEKERGRVPAPVCAGCRAPAGGRAAFVPDAEGGRPRGLLVCAACWRAGVQKTGIAEAFCLELPPQAEAFGAGSACGRLLGARAEALPGAHPAGGELGALLLTWPDGARLVCAPPSLGRFPQLDIAEVAGLSAAGVPTAADIPIIHMRLE